MRKNIDIDERVLEKLKILASVEGTSVESFIEEAISHYIDHREKELLKELSVEEKENLGLLQLMQRSDRNQVASREEIMNHLD